MIEHAHASRASVAVHREHDTLPIVVADDGVGGAALSRGSGLTGLADRVAAIGGTVVAESSPGDGTRVTARLPVSA